MHVQAVAQTYHEPRTNEDLFSKQETRTYKRVTTKTLLQNVLRSSQSESSCMQDVVLTLGSIRACYPNSWDVRPFPSGVDVGLSQNPLTDVDRHKRGHSAFDKHSKRLYVRPLQATQEPAGRRSYIPSTPPLLASTLLRHH